MNQPFTICGQWENLPSSGAPRGHGRVAVAGDGEAALRILQHQFARRQDAPFHIGGYAGPCFKVAFGPMATKLKLGALYLNSRC